MREIGKRRVNYGNTLLLVVPVMWGLVLVCLVAAIIVSQVLLQRRNPDPLSACKACCAAGLRPMKPAIALCADTNAARKKSIDANIVVMLSVIAVAVVTS